MTKLEIIKFKRGGGGGTNKKENPGCGSGGGRVALGGGSGL